MDDLIDKIKNNFKWTYSLKTKSPKFKNIRDIEKFINKNSNATTFNNVSKPYACGKMHTIKVAFNNSNIYELRVIVKERTANKTWKITVVECIHEEFDNTVPQDYLNMYGDLN